MVQPPAKGNKKHAKRLMLMITFEVSVECLTPRNVKL